MPGQRHTLVRFTLLPGQRHDIKSVDDLLEGIDCDAFLGDKAFDAKALRARLAQDGIEAVIPQRKGAAELIDYDREKYKWRHLVENFFCQIKAFRRRLSGRLYSKPRRCSGTRYEKTDKGFAAMIYLVATVLWAK